MKTIGFIDYYLDEWHANRYPEWIAKASDGRMRVAYATALKDADNGLSNRAWCDKNEVQWLDSIEAVVEKSDCLVVLSPDHPEQHERLAELPLMSGKPVYVDKTFAPDRATAIRMFERAERHGTPMYSTSALRYAEEYVQSAKDGIAVIHSVGPGKYDNYSIHQIEPIVSLMGPDARRVMAIGNEASPALLYEFSDGRQASIRHFGWECPFTLTVQYDSGHAAVLTPKSDFFAPFIRDLVRFFETGQPTVDPRETIAVITMIEYGLRALQNPYQWVDLPS